MFKILHIYLDDRECENLLESAVMHGIYLLNIENSVPKEVSEYEKLVVIDNDLCEFYWQSLYKCYKITL